MHKQKIFFCYWKLIVTIWISFQGTFFYPFLLPYTPAFSVSKAMVVTPTILIVSTYIELSAFFLTENRNVPHFIYFEDSFCSFGPETCTEITLSWMSNEDSYPTAICNLMVEDAIQVFNIFTKKAFCLTWKNFVNHICLEL